MIINHTDNKSQFPSLSTKKHFPRKEQSKTPAEKQALAELVTSRAKQESIRDFVVQCSQSLGRAPWSKVNRRPFDDLLDHCILVMNDLENRGIEISILAEELAVTPGRVKVVFLHYIILYLQYSFNV